MTTKLGFLGAAGTVTGSRYLLEAANRRLLIDCGLFQGIKQLRLRNWAAPTVDPGTIDAVVLTHAHIDHSGYLPRLMSEGFRGPIFCTPATLELCRILLPDSGRLQEEDARFANKHGFSKHRPALPLYTQDDADAVLEQFRTVDAHKPFEPVRGISAEFRHAGHILGASFVRLAVDGISITFSGDIGRSNDVLMNPPEAPAATDYLVTESTYGNRIHPVVDTEQELGDWLRRCHKRGGVTVIPGFAVGRVQALLWQISLLKEHGAIADIPVYVDSPMATDATKLYRQFHQLHRLDERQAQRMSTVAKFINSPDESRWLDQQRGPMIIISAAGMATGGRVLHHLKAFVGDERNLVLFAGYQAMGTRGAAMVGGARKLRIHGEEYAIRAEVGQLASASGHADADELLAWMKQLPQPPRRVFVTHGEPEAADALRARIAHELKWDVTVPEHRDWFDL
jgi:metallo-beta-lactamase family protein